MNNQLEISNIAAETMQVLRYFDRNFRSKISSDFLKLLEELSEGSNIVVKIDKNKELKDQNISEGCKDLIAIIYYRFIATEDEKREIIKAWNNNEMSYQNMLREKYNVDNIFKDKTDKNTDKQKIENSLVEIKKDSLIEKIKRFLNKIFRSK
mgnify:CR=1 FL=1